MEIDSPLSDNDETKGPKHEAAIKSPLEGKRCLSSSVSKNHHSSYFLLYSYVPRLSLNLKLPPKRLCVHIPARNQKMTDCPKSGWTAMLCYVLTGTHCSTWAQGIYGFNGSVVSMVQWFRQGLDDQVETEDERGQGSQCIVRIDKDKAKVYYRYWSDTYSRESTAYSK